MAILGKLLKNGIKLWETIEQDNSVPQELQKAELKKLLINARDTEFGQFYRFNEILKSFKSKDAADFYLHYKKAIPIFDYDKIYEEWWYKTRDGQKNVCWPGKVKYFAMSSGTSGDSSKYIPVTSDMINAMHRTSIRQILTLPRYDLPSNLYNKGILMLGGSTQLRKMQSFYDGDLSGITASKIPFWFQHFYKPGKKISRNPYWSSKLDEITQKAKDWDIGVIVGVPAWLQLLLEKIIAHYKVNHIHEIWPNLKIFVHGGVAFEPYKRSFEKLLGKTLIYIETYLASEGFIAFQAYPERNSMRLVLNNGLFYEFIPFNEKNFDAEGKLKDDAETFAIDQVKEGIEYALLLTTCAGTYRYLIGDVIRFINMRESEIVITGRTKHFLSLCGEHLSVDNMNQAVRMVSDKLEIEIKEFAAAGIPDGSLFAHKWWIGCDCDVDADTLKTEIDQALKTINDDYETERKFALKNIYLDKIPTELFYKWMRVQGKEGAQNKFPRVLRKEKLRQWTDFLKNEL